MLGIKFKWECPNCGTKLVTREPFSTAKLMKAAISEQPTKRFYGWKGNFKVISFEQCEYEFTEEKK